MVALVIATVLIAFSVCGLVVLLRAIWDRLLEEESTIEDESKDR